MDISTWFLSPVWSLNLSLLEFLMSLLESLLLSSVICILLLKTLSKPGPLIDDKLMNGRCHKDRIENQRKCLKKIFRIRNPDHLDLSSPRYCSYFETVQYLHCMLYVDICLVPRPVLQRCMMLAAALAKNLWSVENECVKLGMGGSRIGKPGEG